MPVNTVRDIDGHEHVETTLADCTRLVPCDLTPANIDAGHIVVDETHKSLFGRRVITVRDASRGPASPDNPDMAHIVLEASAGIVMPTYATLRVLVPVAERVFHTVFDPDMHAAEMRDEMNERRHNPNA